MVWMAVELGMAAELGWLLGGGLTDGKVSEMIVQLIFSPVLPLRVR
jgi:hypothetical protein